MLSWWGIAFLAAILAFWFHWESGVSWPRHLSGGALVASDLGATIFIGLAVYATAVY